MHPRYEVLRNQEPAPGHTEPLKFLEATPHTSDTYSTENNADLYRLMKCNLRLLSSAMLIQWQIPPEKRTDRRTTAGLSCYYHKSDFLNEFPIPSSMRTYCICEHNVLSGIRCYSGPLRSAPRPPISNRIQTLSSNGDNLGTVLHEILTRYDFRSAAEELRDFLRVAYPTFEEIHCDTTYGTPPQVLVRVREKGMSRSMEMWELSDGMLRFLCLATALLNPWIREPLVAIDEPELGLHPGLLPIVAEMIKTAAERTQVLVTTHSPDLLNCFDIADVAVMSRNTDDAKIAWHRPANRETLVEMLNNVTGETLGDLHRSGELEAGV